MLDFLEFKYSLPKAHSIGAKLLEEAYSLSDFPERGALEPALTKRNQHHRRLVILRDFKIIYRVLGEEIRIDQFFYVRRDPGKMLND